MYTVLNLPNKLQQSSVTFLYFRNHVQTALSSDLETKSTNIELEKTPIDKQTKLKKVKLYL